MLKNIYKLKKSKKKIDKNIFRLSALERKTRFQLAFHEKYKIQIYFPIARHHLAGMTLQYYDLVSSNNNAKLRIATKNENCSILVVDFERTHDTKNG